VDPFTIGGIGFGLAVVGVMVAKAVMPVRITVAKRWPSPPRAVRTQECPYTAAEIADALAWWAERGARFATLAVPTVRAFEPADGGILFDLREQTGWTDDHVGQATTYDANGNGNIERARISFPSDIGRLSRDARRQALLHEVGHALGLPHVDRRGHVMHPHLSRGGLGDRGVREALAGQGGD
jgi:predicted Zn-dependent protease